MNDLRITLVQTDIVWEDIEANRNHLTGLLEPLRGTTDLIILPEMFTTGFTLNGEHLAESMDGVTVGWMQEYAKKTGAVIAGSLIIREQSRLFNRLLWVCPSGEMVHYDKHHLFSYAHEDSVYTAGIKKRTVDLCGWKIRLFICFDLRFPAWSSNQKKEYDLGIYVANWPSSRAAHWKVLLMARAIENQSFIIGVNRVGCDENDLVYSGNSMLVDPQGEVLYHFGSSQEVVTLKIRKSELDEYRKSFPV